MKLLDTIKNALFEVEYVEVKEDGKADEKKEKQKEEKADKPIAKKIILNSRKDKHKVPEEIKPEEPAPVQTEMVTDIENTSEDIIIPEIEETRTSFKIMDDNDFKVESDYPVEDTYPKVEEPKSVEVINNEPIEERIIYRQEPKEKAPYGIDETSKNLIHDYGKAYEKKEEKTGFKPSPIISPIYGVLDKNYRKEDVRDKKEVRLSSYSKENFNVDDVRKKAYGDLEENKKPIVEEKVEDKVVVEEDDNLLVDLSKDDEKPSIKEVTMGDALEYFQDLGLEYNVDYMDASKEKASGRRVKDNYDEEPELFAIEEEPKEEATPDVKEEVKPPVVNNDIDVENDDNLFDLIDSMYDEEK